MASKSKKSGLTCKVKGCGHVERDWLADHLVEAHGLSVKQYLAKHPGADTASKRLMDRANKARSNVRREHPPAPSTLTVKMAGMEFAVNAGVPAESCLPLPAHYRLPRKGDLAKDVVNSLVALKRRRSQYVWGMPGTGKDALFHAWSSWTRTPALIRSVVPGTDIEAWFFSRSFNEQGTYWEEGDVLIALRDGFKTTQGKRIPYLLLVSDLDRADRSQAEYLRLLTDSIQGRISGPMGRIDNVFPGTTIVATANTAGSGDPRGRMVSANPIDAALLDRFNRKFEFHYMDWRDEEPIVRAKHPVLVERAPWVFENMGKATKVLRDAIQGGDIYGEFSHRGLCSVLEHAEDLLICNGSKSVPKNLLKRASRAWLDGLGDPDTRKAADHLMDPYLKGGMLNEGDTSFIKDGNLVPDFAP